MRFDESPEEEYLLRRLTEDLVPVEPRRLAVSGLVVDVTWLSPVREVP